jgi:hypothetical protein
VRGVSCRALAERNHGLESSGIGLVRRLLNRVLCGHFQSRYQKTFQTI